MQTRLSFDKSDKANIRLVTIAACYNCLGLPYKDFATVTIIWDIFIPGPYAAQTKS